jgi:transcriptional regulator with XRE-family HTH domain
MIKVPEVAADAAPLARIVRDLMVDRGFNATALARAAKLNKDYLRNLFDGKSRNPKGEQLTRLAAALGVPLSVLTKIDAADDHIGDNRPDASIELSVLALWRLLDDDGRDLALLTLAKLVAAHARKPSQG